MKKKATQEKPVPKKKIPYADKPLKPMGPRKRKKDEGAPEFYFEQFLSDANNDFAYEIAKQLIAKNKLNGIKTFVFFGPENCGKTHLMASIYHKLKKEMLPNDILYVNAEVFHKKYLRAVRMGRMAAFRETYRNCDYFLLDNLQFLVNKHKTQEELYFTFDTLERMGSRVIVCSRFPLKYMKLMPALVARLIGGLSMRMAPLLKETVIQYMRKVGGLYGFVGDECLDSLAYQPGDSFGYFRKLFQHTMVLFREKKNYVALPSVASSLNFCMKRLNPINMDEILKVVCEYYKISLKDLTSKNGKKCLAEPRAIAMSLMRNLLKTKTSDLQRIFGNRSESSIRYLFNQFSHEPDFKRICDVLYARITKRLEKEKPVQDGKKAQDETKAQDEAKVEAKVEAQ